MARFVDLVAVEGPDRGMRWSVEEGAYRVIARAEDERNSTLQMTPDGDRALDKEQSQLVDSYFQAKSPQTRRSFKKRGPDIVLRDGSVSRTHALVFVDKDGASVVDLMSTNGTKVNDQPVRDVDVKPGDVLWVGKSKLAVEEG
ncbi:MAG: FHA domain-containing protein [Deltaproteobacteria bacterium]|nr:FHA domain-containing protein [Deltaproteobacteria bacterium]